jgi:hypothetical protein
MPPLNPGSGSDHTRPAAINRRLFWIIALLALIILLFLLAWWYNHLNAGTAHFHGRNNDDVAIPNIMNYRHGIHLRKRSMGVYYDTAAIGTYIRDTFPSLVKAQTQYAHPTGGQPLYDSSLYRWVVGFYWMKRKDNSTSGSSNKMDFYVIPTLVLKAPPYTVIDYYSDNGAFYSHGTQKARPSGSALADASGDGNAFDEGQLWP